MIDADFVVLGPAEQQQGLAALRPSGRLPASGSLSGFSVLEAEQTPVAPPFSRRGGWAFWSGGLFLAAASFWISGGHALLLPRGAAPAHPASLSLALLGSETQTARGQSVLYVEAEARNPDARARALPAVAILITTETGAVMRYQVAPPADGIGPSGRQRISTRLPAPADGVRSVSVAFAP